MSVLQWLALLVVYVGYLVCGGLLFQRLESVCDADHDLGADALHSLNRLRETLDTTQSQDLELVLDHLHPTGIAKPPGGSGKDEDGCRSWELYDAIFFSFTVVTTIGYGHIAPSTPWGKVACIFYALLGIPVNAVLIGQLGIFFLHVVKTVMGASPFKQDEGKPRFFQIVVLVLKVSLSLIPGIVLFLVLPSLFFVTVETQWSLLDAFYFSFITLTTIGFGDFVAGRQTSVHSQLGDLTQLYDIFVITWIIFGLGYLVMIIGLIIDGLSTPANTAVKHLKQADKALNYMLRVMQELRATKEIQAFVGRRVASESTLVEDETGGTAEEGGRVRRARSMSNLRHDDTLVEEDVFKPSKKPSSSRSVHSPYEFSRDANSVSSTLTDSFEFDHDTITSLKQFLDTAKKYSGQLSDEGLSFKNDSFSSEESVRGKHALGPTNRMARRQRSISAYSRQVSDGAERLSIEVTRSRPQGSSFSTTPSSPALLSQEIEVSSNILRPPKDADRRRLLREHSPSVSPTPDSLPSSAGKSRSVSGMVGAPREQPLGSTATTASPFSPPKQRRTTSVLIGGGHGRPTLLPHARRPTRSSVSAPISPFGRRRTDSIEPSSFEEMLRTTTLEEFLNAAKTVENSDQDFQGFLP